MSSIATPAHPASGPTPERIFQVLNAHQQTAALKAALDLDLFTAIGEGVRISADLASKVQAAERGVRILCDYLVVLGFLTKSLDEYGLTPEAATFLDRRSPAYLGGIRHFLLDPNMLATSQNLTEVVRKGTTNLPQQGSVTPNNPIWVEFARSMAAMMRPAAQGIAQMLAANPPRRVLDIAAGHGLFGITVAQQIPEAEIVALDWPAVLEVAAGNARNAGVQDRYKLLPGDAFEVEFGTGYDVVLVTNFLHHFDQPTCERLLQKVRAALAPGGCCITLEFVPHEDRVSPPMEATFALVMLATTPSGDAYPFSVYSRMFEAAGFAHNELHRIPGAPQSLIVSRRD